MNLLDIPTEVIDGGLLPFLKWNDLLRFRRVCRVTKDIVTAYLRVHPELAPELEINEEDKTFEAFMEMCVPTTKLFLNNNQSADEFYSKNKEVASKFLEEYGPAIKSLRVHELSMFICGEEWTFFEGLKNLKKITSDRYGFGEVALPFQGMDLVKLSRMKQRKALSDPRFAALAAQSEFPVPAIFKQLQVVKFGALNVADCQAVIDDHIRGPLSIAENWEEVALPFHERPYIPLMDATMANDFVRLPSAASPAMLWGVIMIKNCVENAGVVPKPGEKKDPWKYNLKVVDFANWTDIKSVYTVSIASPTFLALCKSCVKKNVKLENTQPFWFLALTQPGLGSPQVGIPILSLVGIQPCVFFLEMPNLEKVEIRSTYNSSVGNNWRQERPKWPALKTLDITVDSKTGNPHPWITPEGSEGSNLWLDTKQIFHFFFKDVVRPNLIELRLNFVKEAGQVAVPKAKEIVEACPNLKNLTIVNWPGKNKDLLELFGGLPGLEELCFENCKNLGNVTFVGLDTRDPVFFKLKKLKKLTLQGLDQMPKITDLLFTMVIRDLNLTHFLVTSRSALQSVSLAGIRSLLEGDFAKSIEKFPFQDWSLEGVSPEEFQELGKQFRSYSML